MSNGAPLREAAKRPHERRQRKGSTEVPHVDFPRAVLEKFRVLFGSIKTHYRDIESECGVSGSQLWALTEISRQPGMSVSELSSSLLVHQSTASNLLDGLAEMALLAKYRTKEDQRVVRLRLTAKGRDLLSRAPAPTVGVLLDAMQKLPQETLWGLSVNMDDLMAIMNRKDEAAATKPLADL